MKLLEWEVSEVNYQEQINIPKAIRVFSARCRKKRMLGVVRLTLFIARKPQTKKTELSLSQMEELKFLSIYQDSSII